MKTAFITGGSKGIGLGIAQVLMADGINVAITSRNLTEVKEAAEALNKTFNTAQAIGIEADVVNMEAMIRAIETTKQTFGSVDYVIANAGVGYFANIEDLTAAQWQQTMDINLTGVFNTIKASLEELKANKGYFISIASLAGTNFFEKGTAYNASKFGLVGFTQALMMDIRKYDIKVTTIMPGSVATYFNNHIPSDDDAWKIQPEDIGQMVSDLIKMPARTLPSKIEVRPSKTK